MRGLARCFGRGGGETLLLCLPGPGGKALAKTASRLFPGGGMGAWARLPPVAITGMDMAEALGWGFIPGSRDLPGARLWSRGMPVRPSRIGRILAG